VSGEAALGRVIASGTKLRVVITCSAAGPCTVRLVLTVRETRRGGRLVAVTAAGRRKPKRTRTVTVGAVSVTLAPGTTTKRIVSLNAVGRHLLLTRGALHARLTVTQGATRVAAAPATFKHHAGKKRHAKTPSN
jgi:hypothetical protein